MKLFYSTQKSLFTILAVLCPLSISVNSFPARAVMKLVCTETLTKEVKCEKIFENSTTKQLVVTKLNQTKSNDSKQINALMEKYIQSMRNKKESDVMSTFDPDGPGYPAMKKLIPMLFAIEKDASGGASSKYEIANLSGSRAEVNLTGGSITTIFELTKRKSEWKIYSAKTR